MNPQDRGKLYLIPTPLGPDALMTIPEYVLEIVRGLDLFIVEKGKVARQFLKDIEIRTALQECTFLELNKHTPPQEVPTYLDYAIEGRNIGLMSEVGSPAVADPGARLIRMAHRRGIDVVPLVGPSSILLALMASGMNGQRFAFHGYLSPKRPMLAKDLKRLETHSARHNETQIFIETPYRNMGVYETALQVLSPSTLFGLATDLTLPTQWVHTFSILEWRSLRKPRLHKRPTVFLLLGHR